MGAALSAFHPAVSGWFEQTFSAPTQAQVRGWAAIGEGRDTLIAAPTGSGKTLAAFLSAIDTLVRDGVRDGCLPDATQVVYVSPLKALSNDIERNLAQPLAGIATQLEHMGLPTVDIRVAVRTGDTPSSARVAMVKRPPHILVTTPESLYILLTSAGGQRMLAHTKSVIVDEIHAVVGDKRGAHLALTLERLSHLAGCRVTRIGLSATQRPIARVASFLTGRVSDSHACAIVDTGHRRDLDLQISLPPSPLQAVTSGEVWEEIYDQLAGHVQAHQTTLIFVNARRMTERIARHLQERLGPGVVAAHHGSLARKQRLRSEQQLKRGELRVLVATASMELGIDIGSVDLVCQLGPTRSIASLLQRIGRAGHQVGATSKGLMFPLTRDDLITCLALKRSIEAGELDIVHMPVAPLDILAQQLVATVASCHEQEGWDEDELFALVTKAAPFSELSRADFDEVVGMLADGVATRRGRRAAYLHRDGVYRRLRARRGGRLTAITSGGAIPDNADYAVVLEPTGTVVGSVHEDFAVESMAGDVFQLGNTSWRILKVEPGKVRVEDAAGQPPSLPFWIGEVPGRSEELSQAVDLLRSDVARELGASNACEPTTAWLANQAGVDPETARQAVEYLAAAKAALGVMPSREDLVLERFFDGSGGMQLVVHAPFGTRINRAWGLSLRKRFCRKFNFELQAAATDDAIVISLGEVHSFPLAEVFAYLRTPGLRDLLIQALLDSPMFAIRWRWNANRSLAVPRFRGGRRVAPQLQRMQADDLASVVFPDQGACLENIAGAREVPDHPLVRQTVHDCLTEAMDIQGFTALIAAIERGEKRLHTAELTEPSPLAHEIIHARPYAFLDDAPLEERRTQAVRTRRYIDPASAEELGRLDPVAISDVCAQAWPVADNTEELHDALLQLGYLTAQEVRGGTTREGEAWPGLMDALVTHGRATRLPGREVDLWVAAERLTRVLSQRPQVDPTPSLNLSAALQTCEGPEVALVELVRARLSGLGPVTSARLACELEIELAAVDAAVLALEAEGYAVRGNFQPGEGLQWCERGLLARMGRYTLKSLRRAISPVTTAAFMRFLMQWQGVDEPSEGQGPEVLMTVLGQLEGYEVAAASWEAAILPTRFRRYQPGWLDTLCQSGQMTWGRLAAPTSGGQGAVNGPVRTTPMTLLPRQQAALWHEVQPVREGAARETSSQARLIEKQLCERGAQFFTELVRGTRMLATEVERALGELVAVGRVSSDGYAGLRALLAPKTPRSATRRRARGRRPAVTPMDRAGRWFMIAKPDPVDASEEDFVARAQAVTHIAKVLLRRYGVVFRRLLTRERNLPPWRELLRVLRRLEARGEVRGGRFVHGALCGGEQFALPEAIAPLRGQRDAKIDRGRRICVDATDPLNLAGVILPGSRVPAILGNRLVFHGGEVVATREAGVIRHIVPQEPTQAWEVDTLLSRTVGGVPRLRA